MKTIHETIHISKRVGWYALIILFGLFNVACTATSTKDLRSKFQNNIKERVARVDTIGAYKVGYLTSEDLLETRYFSDQSSLSRKSNIGAFRFTRIGDKEVNGSMYMLYRSKGNFMAETKVAQTGETKYFFSFGVNKSTKMPALNLRVEF